MKFVYLLLCLVPSLAIADIYKYVDAGGHVTYSNAPIKGGKRVSLTPLAQNRHARSAESPHDFPKVNEETQKGRDGARRKILEDELKTEEGLLGSARQNLKAGEAMRDDAKLKALNKQVDLHQENIDALKTELSRLK